MRVILAALLSEKIPMDRSRMYSTGHSSGGIFGFRLAFEVPELAGVASRAGRAWYNAPSWCND